MQQLPWQLLMQMLQPPLSRYLSQICCPWDHLYHTSWLGMMNAGGGHTRTTPVCMLSADVTQSKSAEVSHLLHLMPTV